MCASNKVQFKIKTTMADNQEKTPRSTNQDEEAALSEQKEQHDKAETANNPEKGGASSSDNANDQKATPRMRSKTSTVDHPNGGYETYLYIWNSDGSKKMIVTKVLPLDDDDQEYKLVTYRKKNGETYSEEHLTNLSEDEVEDFIRKFPPQKTNQDEIQENTETSGPSETSFSGNNDQVSASQNDNECPYFPETPATRKEDDVQADEDIPAVVEQKVLVNGVPFVDGVGAPTPEENSVAENNENIEQTSSVTYSSILNKSKEIDVPASDTTAAEDVATTNTEDNGSTHVEDSVSTSTNETGKKSDEEGSDTTTDSDMPLIMEEDKTNGN